eukprot:gnl/Hemi2/10974_TR3761_c0_g5_i1.p1 gnl/Hemi2/10974_TR3761_c0_g5~~gnl/Hemi2/10974_TR3761_c0_g5_i1.p1  ORF type:complete len:273 (-),score=18.34 gnl/Hemi2/10974_TR3761_c0_g5_i1:241-1059(-)
MLSRLRSPCVFSFVRWMSSTPKSGDFAHALPSSHDPLLLPEPILSTRSATKLLESLKDRGPDFPRRAYRHAVAVDAQSSDSDSLVCCQPYATLLELLFMHILDQLPPHDATGFVVFSTKRQADKAMSQLNAQKRCLPPLQAPVVVRFAPTDKLAHRLVVRNIPASMTKEDFCTMFEKYGKTTIELQLNRGFPTTHKLPDLFNMVLQRDQNFSAAVVAANLNPKAVAANLQMITSFLETFQFDYLDPEDFAVARKNLDPLLSVIVAYIEKNGF